MYCSKCGNSVNKKLKFCNNCGAKLKNELDEDSSISPLNSLIGGLIAVSIAGLAILVGLLAVLLDKGVSHPLMLIFAGVYLFVLYSITSKFWSLISKMINTETGETEQITETAQPFQISAPDTAQLEAPKQPPASVTDNTTRTLEEIYVERK